MERSLGLLPEKGLTAIEIILCDYVQSQDFYLSVSKGITFHMYTFLVSSQFSPRWAPLYVIWARSPISLSSFQLSLLKAPTSHQQSQLWLSEQYFPLWQLSTPFNETKGGKSLEKSKSSLKSNSTKFLTGYRGIILS